MNIQELSESLKPFGWYLSLGDGQWEITDQPPLSHGEPNGEILARFPRDTPPAAILQAAQVADEAYRSGVSVGLQSKAREICNALGIP